MITLILTTAILLSNPTWQPEQVNTPESLSIWMQKDLKYISDTKEEDSFKSPEQTVKDGGGDCEDFARLSHYLLSKWGYDSKIIAIYRPKGNHAVTVFKNRDGFWQMFDLQHIRPQPTRGVIPLVTGYYPDWIKIDVVNEHGFRLTTIKRRKK